MVLVQVFGNNGSGKTSLLRNLAASDPQAAVHKTSPKLSFTSLPQYQAVLVGDYLDRTRTTAGVDRLSPKTLILEALDAGVAMTKAAGWRYLVWEGIIIMTRQYHAEYVARGLSTSYVFLNVEPEVCIKRVLARSGKVAEDLKGEGAVIRRRHSAIERLRQWARQASYRPDPTSHTVIDIPATEDAATVLKMFYLYTFYPETRLA